MGLLEEALVEIYGNVGRRFYGYQNYPVRISLWAHHQLDLGKKMIGNQLGVRTKDGLYYKFTGFRDQVACPNLFLGFLIFGAFFD